MKTKRGAKKPRNTIAKKIESLAKTDPLKALQFADYGQDAERVLKALLPRIRNRCVDGGVKDPRALAQFIDEWLFIRSQQTDPELKRISRPGPMAHQKQLLEIETLKIFPQRIMEGDADFFYDFADLLKAGVQIYKAATLDYCDKIRRDLLGYKLAGQRVNLSQVAKENGVSFRTVWRINQAIGAKPMPSGRPSKVPRK